MIHCAFCGAEMSASDRFCGACGQKIEAVVASRPHTSAPAARPLLENSQLPGTTAFGGMRTGYIAAVVALLGIGLIVYAAIDSSPWPQASAPQPRTAITTAAPPTSAHPAPQRGTPKAAQPTASANIPARPAFSGYVMPETLIPWTTRRDNVYTLHQPMRMQVFYPETFAFTSPSVSGTKLGSLTKGFVVELRGWLRDAKGESWARICLPPESEKALRCAWIDYDSLVAIP